MITASEPSWTAPFDGLSPRPFGKLITALRRDGADPVRKGRPWGRRLEDRVLLVAAYGRGVRASIRWSKAAPPTPTVVTPPSTLRTAPLT